LHDITADQGQFGSKLLKPSQNWSYTFSKAGTYTYKCVPHPWMKGTIIVK
jgi:plastocyanin